MPSPVSEGGKSSCALTPSPEMVMPGPVSPALAPCSGASEPNPQKLTFVSRDALLQGRLDANACLDVLTSLGPKGKKYVAPLKFASRELPDHQTLPMHACEFLEAFMETRFEGRQCDIAVVYRNMCSCDGSDSWKARCGPLSWVAARPSLLTLLWPRRARILGESALGECCLASESSRRF